MTTASARRYGTFSFLPAFTDEDMDKQIRYILDHRLIPAIEYTRDPSPGNAYWSMWKLPLFDAREPEEVLAEVRSCSEANPDSYVRLNGYDPKRQGQVASLVVRRPH